VVAYNDTNSNPRLNIPLRIHWGDKDTKIVDLYADTSWIDGGHFRSGEVQKFKIVSPFTYEKRIYAGRVDVVNHETPYYFYYSEVYDTSQTWTVNEFDFGRYVIREPSQSTWDNQVVRIRNDGTHNYLYVYCKYSHWTLAEGDSFEVYRLSNAPATESPQLVCHWQDRQWRAGYSNDPSYIKFSERFYLDSFILGSDYYYVNKDDGDKITALVPMSYQNCLLIGKTKSLYTLSGVAGVNATVNQFTSGVGIAAPASVVSHGRNVYFYDYNGFYMTDGNSVLLISADITPILTDSIDKNLANQIVGGYFDGHIWWTYADIHSNHKIIIFNIDTEKWMTASGFNFSSLFVGLSEMDSNGVLLGDADSGIVYRYGLNYLDNGNPITLTYESPWLSFDNLYRKDFKDAKFLMDKADSSLFKVGFYLNQSDTLVFKDTLGVDAVNHIVQRRLSLGNTRDGYNCKFKIEVTEANEEFKFEGFSVDWKVLSELNYEQ
jgi:hypothetical protein